MDFIIGLLYISAIPALVVGTLIALPTWVFWWIQKLFRRPISHLNKAVLALISLFSFIAMLIIYTYSIIFMDYAFTIPSSPIATEKQLYFGDAVAEALRQSIIPPAFQTRCVKEPELVCELGAGYALSLWDSHITSDDIPFLSATISALTSGLLVIIGHGIFNQLVSIPKDQPEATHPSST